MKKIFLFILLFPLLHFGQSLSGNYLVGSGQTFPFNTLTNAVARLNLFGVSGPVTFILTDANYSSSETFPITINQYTGTSATNTLTIKPNTNVNTVISGSVSGDALIKLNGADNIIIDGSNNGTTSNNLTIYNSFNTANSYNTRAAINLYNTSSKNTFRNLTLKLNILGVTNGTTSCGFMAGGSTLGNAGNNPDNEITNVIFTDVKQGIYINGSTASSNANWRISNCSIGSTTDSSKPFLGIYINKSNTYNISGNTLNGLKRPNGLGGSATNAGIIATSSDSGTISNNALSNIENATGDSSCVAIQAVGSSLNIISNTIDNVKTSSTNDGNTGIYCDGSNNTIYNNKVSNVQATNSKLINGIYTNGNNALVYNNFVVNVSSLGGGSPDNQGGYGIYINSGTVVKLYFNSVRLQTTQSSATGASAALFINGGTQLTIVNNIFINAQSAGASRFAVYSNVTNTSSFTSIDYNDYVSVQYIGSFGSYYTSSNLKTTLADWKSATTKDINSINITPTFVSSTDLHLSAANTNFDDKGIPVTGITTDIDSDIRSTALPDMGADEYAKCSNGTTVWNGTSWSNGNPSITVKVIINGNYDTAINGSFKACELVINANKTLNIATNNSVEVQNDIRINTNGNLNVIDSGSLVQNDDAAICTGNAKITRTSTLMKQYDYAYWSSPVTNFALSSFTPNDVYSYSFNPTINNWDWNDISSTIMTAAKGYIVRAPENGLTTQKVTTNFFGNPNTGTINYNIVRSSLSGFNLIGNPYPSALDADLFLGNATNAASTMGTIYLWTHNTAIGLNNPNPGSGTYAYSSDDYAKYNRTGSVGTRSSSIGNNNSVPNGKIATGQAFFIEASSGVATKGIVFNNSMRVKGENNNSQIFRQSVTPNFVNSSSVSSVNETVIEKNRVWINVSNNQGAFNQMLLGYITGATDGFDNGFDGKTFEAGNYIGIYSILDDYQLSIQGKSLAFDANKPIPIGFKNTIGGEFAIELENFDGFFNNQNIYLFDKETQISTNLKETKYNFQSSIGEFNHRFELRFENVALSTIIPKTDSNDIIVYKNNNQVKINSRNENLQSVVIYDVLGRIIYTKNNIDNKSFSSEELQINDPFIVIKIKTKDGVEINKKMLFK